MRSIWIVQISIKFTNEPPQGIRASLKRTYSDVSQVGYDLKLYEVLGTYSDVSQVGYDLKLY